MTLRLRVMTTAVVLGMVSLFVMPGLSQAPSMASSVMNKTYSLWVSQSFAAPPYPPFQDCARFSKTQMCLAQCGDCGPLSEVQLGDVSIWTAKIPCGGLNLLFQGVSRNGPQLPAVGATVVGLTQQSNFGAEGLQDQSCSIGPSRVAGGTPYSKP